MLNCNNTVGTCRDDDVHNREWCAGKIKKANLTQQGTEGRLGIEWSASHIPHSIPGFPHDHRGH